MKKIYLFIILGICIVGRIFPQSQYFSKTLDLTGSWEFTCSMISVSDGYIITGNTAVSGSPTQLFILKVNSEGDTIWSKYYKHPVRSYTSGMLNCIVNRMQGGFFVFGTTRDTIGGNVDAMLYCFDNNGDTIFTKQIGGSTFEKGISLVEANDGSIYALGETSQNDPNGDVQLIKLDPLGNIIWEKIYGIPNVADNAHTISIDGDHNIYLGTSYLGGWAGNLPNNVPRLIKVDSSGTQKFIRTVNTTDVNLPSGSYGFAHLHTPNQIYLFSRPSNDGYVGIMYVTVFDSLGAQLYNKAIIGPRVLIGLGDFFSLNDGSLMLCGQGNTVPSWTYNGWDTEDDGGLILKLNPAADSVWARYYVVHPGQYQSLFYGIEPSPFGGYFLAGTYVNGPVQDIWLMSVDANGCLGTDSCGVEQPVVTMRDADVYVGGSPLLVYPNPTSHFIHIQIPGVYSSPSSSLHARKKASSLYDPMHRSHTHPFLEPENEIFRPAIQHEVEPVNSTSNCILYLYSSDGRLITSMIQPWTNTMEMSLEGIPNGLYFLRVEYGGNVYGERVVKMN